MADFHVGASISEIPVSNGLFWKCRGFSGRMGPPLLHANDLTNALTSLMHAQFIVMHAAQPIAGPP